MLRRRLLTRLAFLAAFLVDLVIRPTLVPDIGIPQDLFVAVAAAQDAHTDRLLGMHGVVGTAIGLTPAGEPVLQVLVTELGAAALPRMLDDVPVHIQVTGRIYALGDPPDDAASSLDPRSRFPRPVPIGVSTGQPDVTAGTIGARVTDGTHVYALSNNHVFANSNAAEIGDNILQPGVADGGSNPTHAIGTLTDYEPIKRCNPVPFSCPDNLLDAAIAETTLENLGNATPTNGYGVPRATTATAALNQTVQKYGRTTGHTVGQVTGIRATLTVDYRHAGTARFVNQIVVAGTGFSRPGDSGSLIVTRGAGTSDRRPVGLLFAGSQTTTIANPIDLVLERFNVTIDGN